MKYLSAIFLFSFAFSCSDLDSQLTQYNDKQHTIIIDSCIKIIATEVTTNSEYKTFVVSNNKLPQELSFISFDLVRVSNRGCTLFIDKGLGKGAGFSVDLKKNGKSYLSWFNDYKGWDYTHPIMNKELANTIANSVTE